MKLSRTLAGLVAAGLVTATAGGLSAGQRQAGTRAGAGIGPGAPMTPGLPLAQLGVTEAQRPQIAALTRQHRADMRPLMQRARAARASLLAAMTADPLDDTVIRTRTAEVAAIEGDLAVAQAHLLAAILGVLTPEQQAKARERWNRRASQALRGPAI